MRDQDFWNTFTQLHWAQQAIRLESGLTPPNSSIEDFFRWVVLAPQKRFFRGTVLVQEESFFPTLADRSFEQYHQRILQLLPDTEYSLVVGGLETTDSNLWKWVVQTLTPLYQIIGSPAGFSEISAFIGNYSRTPFGVHQDRSGVLAMPLIGTKRMRLWPREYGLAHPDLDRSHQYEAFIPSSSLLEATPGQALYWPSEAWHVAEGDGTLNVSWSIGFWDALPARILYEATHEIVRLALEEEGSVLSALLLEDKNLVSDPPLPLPDSLPKVQCRLDSILRDHLFTSPRIQHYLQTESLRRETSLGFCPVPLQETQTETDENPWMQTDPRFPIQILKIRDGHLLVSALGHVIETVAHPNLLYMLERLSANQPIPRRTLIQSQSPFPHECPTTSTPSPDDLENLLDFLERIHAIQKVGL
tara:strand:- start:102 stop:1352 length:1251 start_codon:yes stop_codon:yes gene_type:complete